MGVKLPLLFSFISRRRVFYAQQVRHVRKKGEWLQENVKKGQRTDLTSPFGGEVNKIMD